MKIEKGFGQESGPIDAGNMERLRDFIRVKQREIFAADPIRGDGDFGSTVTMMLMIGEANSESRIAELLWQDHLETLDGEQPESDEEEKIKDRLKTTVENLKTSGVIVEEGGALRFNM